MLNKNKLGKTWLYAVYAFTQAEALGNKSDCHKIVKANPGSSFQQIWKYLSTRCWQPTKSQGNRPLGSEEGDFLRFFPNMSLKAILVMWPRTFEQISIPNIPWKRHMKFDFINLVFFWGREVWKCWIWVILDKGKWMTLTLGCHKSSCTHLFDQLPPHRLQ